MKHLTRFITAGFLLALLLTGRAAPPTQAQGLAYIVNPLVTGEMCQNDDWYCSDVTVTWIFSPDLTVNSGCETRVIDYDTPGEVLTCEATAPNGDVISGVVTVKRDATPPVINANLSPDPNAPTVVNEGDTIQVNAWATDATSGIAGIIMLDLDQNGSFEAQNGAPFVGIDGIAQGDRNPDFLVAQVADQAGNVAQATYWVSVANLPPNLGPVSLSAGTIPLGGSVEASVNFIDPGILDTHTAVIDWGDGPKTSLAAVSESGGKGVATDEHTYIIPGSHTIEITVTDKDGGVSTATASVTVLDGQATIGQVLIPGVTGLVEANFINHGQGNALTTKLVGAQTKLAQGKDKPAVNKLNAALNQMNAIAKGDLGPDFNVAITGLIYDTANLIGALRAVTPSD